MISAENSRDIGSNISYLPRAYRPPVYMVAYRLPSVNTHMGIYTCIIPCSTTEAGSNTLQINIKHALYSVLGNETRETIASTLLTIYCHEDDSLSLFLQLTHLSFYTLHQLYIVHQHPFTVTNQHLHVHVHCTHTYHT